MNLLIVLPAANDPDGVLVKELRRLFPGLTITNVERHDQAWHHIDQTDILLTFGKLITDELVSAAVGLKWVQVLGSGLDGITDRSSIPKNILITSAHGIQAVPVSEAAIMLMLSCARDVPQLVRNQDKALWHRQPPRLLNESTVVIVGVGAIAEALALKCAAFGMEVVGVSSRSSAPGFGRMFRYERIQDAAAIADYFVVLTPLGPTTRGVIDEQVLRAIKSSGWLINLSRGGIVDEAALVATLRSGHLAGAALDVFVDEPLSRDHPLWTTRGVLISPHIGGLSNRYVKDLVPLLKFNVGRFLAGDLEAMRNIVRR
ncbi:MAG: D-2-hydroxyacid dehydrogenase [Rhizomicrobium sp.]